MSDERQPVIAAVADTPLEGAKVADGATVSLSGGSLRLVGVAIAIPHAGHEAFQTETGGPWRCGRLVLLPWFLRRQVHDALLSTTGA